MMPSTSRKLRVRDVSLAELPLIFVPEARDAGGRGLEKILKQSEIDSDITYHVDTFEAAAGKSAYAKAYGRHSIYCSALAEDRSDPRLAFVVKEQKSWCARHD